MEENKEEGEKVSEENVVYLGEDGVTPIRGRITVDQYLEAQRSYLFHPPGKTLITKFLMRKVKNQPMLPIQIPEEPNLYDIHPEDLAKNHHLRNGRQPMFFYTRRRKNGNGEYGISEKVDGFWKILEADIPVKSKKKVGQIIGLKNRLEFSGNQITETQWRMNEFRLYQKEKEDGNITKVDEWVVCRIYMYRSKDDEEAWDVQWYFSSDDED